MRSTSRVKLVTILSACAVLVFAAKLFTCIITLTDDPTTYLAIKRHPAFANVVVLGDEPVRRDYILLDDDENQLVYEPLYLGFTGHAEIVAGGCLAAALAVLLWPRRRPGPPP